MSPIPNEHLTRPLPYYRIIKRLIDLIIASASLILLAPLLILIAVLIWIDSRGPALFKQQRIGLDGKPFTFYKFRSMKIDTDPLGFSPSHQDDPRLTRIGQILREWSLDELPQLFNVIRSEMSLVGPRPLLPWQYERWTSRQRQRLLVKPGMTGWAQVHGRAEVAHDAKIELDLHYVQQASVGLDLRIIWTTITQNLGRSRIYETNYYGTGPENSPNNNSREIM